MLTCFFFLVCVFDSILQYIHSDCFNPARTKRSCVTLQAAPVLKFLLHTIHEHAPYSSCLKYEPYAMLLFLSRYKNETLKTLASVITFAFSGF